MGDPIADTDQRREHAKRHAQVVDAFYVELVREGVPENEASWISREYLEQTLIDDGDED